MLAPCPERRILRRMDYLSDQEGILRRFRRERKGWETHLKNTREFITESLTQTEVTRLVVLGSGWLLDFPLDELPPSVEKISLVDVNFPREVENLSRKSGKVELIKADITGGYIQAIYEQLRQGKKIFTIPEDIAPPSIAPEKGKVILSLNILNQLDILLVDYIKRKMKAGDDEIAGFRRLLQESHLNMLRPHPFILVSDHREVSLGEKGQVEDDKSLLFTDLPKGEFEKEWDWMFDSNRLYNENANTLLKVRAIFSKGL
jgi:hypothetical protein